MKLSITTKFGAFLCMLVASAATLVLVCLFDGMLIASDAGQNISVARNLLAGRGLQTDLIIYEEHYRLNSWPVPQTVFPPGFPLLIAAVSGAGLSLPNAAFGVGVISFWILPQLIYRLAIRSALHPAMALTTSVAWLAFAINWANPLMCLTDLVFVALTLASVLLLCPNAEADPAAKSQTTKRLFQAGILAAMAFLIRYAGIFWLPAAAFAIARQSRFVIKETVLRCAVFLSVPAACVGGCFWRNMQLVGNLKGGNNHKVVDSATTVVRNVWYATSQLLGVDHDALIRGRLQEVIITLGLILAITAVLIYVRRGGWKLQSVRLPGSSVPETLLVWFAVTISGLAWLDRTTSLTISARMLQPLIPAGLLAISVSASQLWKRGFVQPRLFATACCLITVGFMVAQLQAVPQCLSAGSINSTVYRAVHEAVALESQPGDDRQIHTPASFLKGKRILSQESQCLGQILGQGTIGLDPYQSARPPWPTQEVLPLIRHYEITHIVRFPKIIELPVSDNPEFYDRLATESLPQWLAIKIHTPDIIVYEVRQRQLPVVTTSSQNPDVR